jgi:hypothetical protein
MILVYFFFRSPTVICFQYKNTLNRLAFFYLHSTQKKWFSQLYLIFTTIIFHENTFFCSFFELPYRIHEKRFLLISLLEAQSVLYSILYHHMLIRHSINPYYKNKNITKNIIFFDLLCSKNNK